MLHQRFPFPAGRFLADPVGANPEFAFISTGTVARARQLFFLHPRRPAESLLALKRQLVILLERAPVCDRVPHGYFGSDGLSTPPKTPGAQLRIALRAVRVTPLVLKPLLGVLLLAADRQIAPIVRPGSEMPEPGDFGHAPRSRDGLTQLPNHAVVVLVPERVRREVVALHVALVEVGWK